MLQICKTLSLFLRPNRSIQALNVTVLAFRVLHFRICRGLWDAWWLVFSTQGLRLVKVTCTTKLSLVELDNTSLDCIVFNCRQ